MEPVSRAIPDRVGKRITRLESLLDVPARDSASAFDAGVDARRDLLAARPNDDPLRMVKVRSGLFCRNADEVGPTRIQKVSTSKGAALKVLLLVLFELQARPSSRSDAPVAARTMLPLETKPSASGGAEVPSWVTFSALPTADSTRRAAFAGSRRRNRLRQLCSALERLHQLGRIELRKPPGQHGRYESFRILDEGRVNDGATGRAKYTVPVFETGRARRKITTIPSGFFLNGWIDALSDNEIITYLVLRFCAQAYPNEHATKGVFLSSGFRDEMFNLDRGFEAHRMLARYGLIKTIRDPRRSPLGTIHQQGTDGKGELHRFQLADDALSQNAPARVITCLQRYANHESLDDSLSQDRADAKRASPLAGAAGGATGSFFGD
ncbi:hypothetical protein [Amycolatopsis sp. YIM 10]|uniref:hypothetical protein n=1 Tax=Amycolatopsis sp. YIM 10 TaxID=2653857 RepID=UPI00128FEA4F|nr:hypothetical protein [Amycolatopsis sp. YIM 10]QFU92574.1 hypothetical protein YIM_37080 [Amycolatopsis sp. YIM 10]